LLDSIGSGTGGEFFFVKSPKTKVRLLNFQDDPQEFFAPVKTVYRNKEKTKFMIFAKVIGVDGQGAKPLGDNWKNKVAPLVITKTALKAIITLLAEGYDLFDPEEGYGVTIIRSGSGTDTDYTATPSRDPIPVDLNSLEMPEVDLFEMAARLEAKNASRNTGAENLDEDDNPF
jgi:hypothetical protein